MPLHAFDQRRLHYTTPNLITVVDDLVVCEALRYLSRTEILSVVRERI
jgi:hypothetical protein